MSPVRSISTFRCAGGISHERIRGEQPSLDPAFIAKCLGLFALCVGSEFLEKRLLGHRGIADLIVRDSARLAAVEFFRAPGRVALFRGGSPD
jgi:hypothetical protein